VASAVTSAGTRAEKRRGVNFRAVSLTSGIRVGPYEVIEPLGAGGMGQVFRARDARLKRDVALKVLSIAGGVSTDYRARFEREAQVLASLNHPRIAQIYGVEDHDGAPVIAMELVEGATLADRIARGPVPLDEALSIAAQMCDGLEAAHERGIVHRDLKPANIKLRSGHDFDSVTILDFGLARAIDSGVTTDPTNSPTMMGGATGIGVVMGTAAYMSPEQARGRAVDKRADIWAFGCVVYEMLTGTQAFAGESTTDILAGVVQRDPDWTKLPATLPSRIVDLLRRCLEKNPKDRLRDIGDARYEITRTHTTSQTHTQPTAPAGESRRRVLGYGAASLIGAAVTAAIALVMPGRKADVSADVPVRVTIQLPPDTTLALSRGSAVALSPDGRRLVYAARLKNTTQLFVRSLDHFESQAIAGTDNAENPFFSTDGRWVGFFAAGKLKKVALDGGSPIVLADARAPRGEVWSGDSMFVTPANTDPIVRISALDGKATPVTTLEKGELSHRWPRVLPSGAALLFTVWNDNGWEPSRIAGQHLDSKTHRIVVEAGASYPHFIRDRAGRGYLVYARSEGLLAAPFDESKLALSNQPVPVVDSVVTNLSGGAHFDLSASGTLAYVPGSVGESARELAWVQPDGASELLAKVRIPGRSFRLSPDGTRIARNNAVSANGGVWIEDIARNATVRFSESPDDYAPIWSKDGEYVIYARFARGSGMYRRKPVPSAPEETIVNAEDFIFQPADAAPDGKTVAFVSFDPVSASDIFVTQVGGGVAPRPFVKTKFSEGGARFSPDGRWVAYQSNESGRFEVYARSFPDGDRTIQLSTDGGLSPEWSPDGRRLYYYGSSGKMTAVPIESAADLRIGKSVPLFDCRPYEPLFSVAPDGKRFLMMPVLKAEQAGSQIQLVMNFVSELRQRVK
jgi:eukaryotic-like serine/threonine-protein kinase